MQINIIQNSQDFAGQSRPGQPFYAPAPSSLQVKQQAANGVSGFFQSAIRRMTSKHTECDYEIAELQAYETNLNRVLAELVKDRQRLASEQRSAILPPQPRMIVSTDDDLISQLNSENLELREALKRKFDASLKNSLPETVESKAETFEDMMPDRKSEQIKLLQQALLAAEDRLKRYYMRVSPEDLAQLQRENTMLKDQVLDLAAQRQNYAATQIGQYPVRMYPELKEKNKLLTDLIRRLNPYLMELKQKADGLDSSQMVYDLQNRHLQFETAKMDRARPSFNVDFERNRTQMRFAELQSEYLRLQQLVKTGSLIQGQAYMYNLAVVGKSHV